MSTEQEIHPKFVGRHCRPIRRFAGDKGVDPLLRNLVDFRAGAAGDDPDCSSFLRTEHEGFYGTTQCFLQFAIKFIARQRNARLYANQLTFFFEERLIRFKSECCGELRVIAELRMEIERQMCTVNRDVVFKGEFQLPAQRFGHGTQARRKSAPESAQEYGSIKSRPRQSR